MKGDFSRDTFDPRRGYQSVLHQQGRMVLDADLNEQAASHLHLMRQMACDLIGPHGGPGAEAGFEITIAENGTILIGPGRYYVGGVHVEVPQLIEYNSQPFFRPAADDALSSADRAANGSTVLMYLEVFERAVSAAEDPSLADPALGGSDTALRRQTVWHVRSIETGTAFAQIETDEIIALLDLETGARLAIRAAQPTTSGEISGYLGADNRLFRIEIHRGGGAGEAQYKWSRDNGVIVGSWHGFDGDLLRLSMREALQPPAVVELSDGPREAAGLPGVLVEIAADRNDCYRIVTGDIEAVRALWETSLSRPFVRRWELLRSGPAPGLAFVQVSQSPVPLWTFLGDGLEIAFEGGPFIAGDYWQLAARPGADLLWPGGRVAGLWKPKFCVPAGPLRWRAPLALVGKEEGRPAVRDLRRRFAPLM